ncbi:hypothetical protein ATX76_08065 [Oenococcus oeni]|nr:hypothetical protein ATX76_08065 [Oenococcus oeni]
MASAKTNPTLYFSMPTDLTTMDMALMTDAYADQIAMNGSKAWTESYRVKVFKKWQAYMNKEAAYAPGSFSYTWAPVNHRVKGYNVSPSNNEFWSNLSLTSSKIK